MGTRRMEAFSDGVIAIIITIMVLELKVPHGTDLAALGDLLPELANYVLSFVYVAIYWDNHHHLLHACDRINGAIMWANMHFLFWLSLILLRDLLGGRAPRGSGAGGGLPRRAADGRRGLPRHGATDGARERPAVGARRGGRQGP